MHVELRGKFGRIGSLIPVCASQNSNPDFQAQQQVTSLPKPLYPLDNYYFCYIMNALLPKKHFQNMWSYSKFVDIGIYINIGGQKH